MRTNKCKCGGNAIMQFDKRNVIIKVYCDTCSKGCSTAYMRLESERDAMKRAVDMWNNLK